MDSRTQFVRWVAGVILTLAASSAALAQNGTLTAQFLHNGPVPNVAPAPIPAACGVPVVIAPVINAKNKGVANVVVWLDTAAAPLPAGVVVPAQGAVTVANRACVFEPHIAVIRTNQAIDFTNADAIAHNVKGEPRNSEAFNILLQPGGKFTMKVTAAQNLPCPISCSIHPFMQGFLVVQDHPFVAVSDKDGKIAIPNLPPGKWTFVAWHEVNGFVKAPVVDGKPDQWRRGRFTINVAAGAVTNLGKVEEDFD